MIKNFQTAQEYQDYIPSQSQTDISYVEGTKDVHINGVNVIAKRPVVGDVVFLDEGNDVVIVSAATLQKESLPAIWTHVGYVYRVLGNRVGVIDKNTTNIKFENAATWKVSISPSLPTMIGTMYVSVYIGGVQTQRTLSVQLSHSASNVSNTIGAAIRQDTVLKDLNLNVSYSGNDVYIKQVPETAIIGGMTINGNYNGTVYSLPFTKVDSYHESAYGNDPVRLSDILIKNWNRGNTSASRLVVSVQRAAPYLETNGSDFYNVYNKIKYADVVFKKTVFDSNDCAALKAYYGTYENYVAAFQIEREQSGALFDYYRDHFDEEYGDITINGTMKVYPAIALCNEIAYQNEAFAAGKWHLPTIRDIMYLIDEDALTKLNGSTEKMGTPVFDANLNRWALGRYYYNGSTGMMEPYRKNSDSEIAQAVTEIEI